MARKTLFISLVLFGFVFFQTSKLCFAATSTQLEQAKMNIFSLIKSGNDAEAQAAVDSLIADFSGDPDLPAALYDIAREYRWCDKYDQAKSMYQQIIQQYPDSLSAGRARLGVSRTIVLSLIKSEDYAAALTAIDNIIAEFSGHSDLPETLYWFANNYKWSLRYEEAKSIYEQVIQGHAGSHWASQAQLFVRKLNIFPLIDSGQMEAAQAAVDSLVADFSGHPDLPGELHWVGRKYEDSEKYEEAKSIYQQIVQQYADSSAAEMARLDVAKMDVLPLIESGKEQAAHAVIDGLMADFQGSSYLPMAVLLAGEQVYKKALQLEREGLDAQAKSYFQKAVNIFERVINELPGSDDTLLADTPNACSMAGYCYYQLGEYQKSLECSQRVVDDYPRFYLFWHSLFMVGRNYDKLKKTGAISESQADLNTKAAYEQLLESYPDCEAAADARSWMNHYNSK